ncbi:MAG: UDP-N-acetylmuramate dehydrogenase [Dehalococcoidia bacterium]|nr:UDP-N-acetylmuramate dehydrogenase [Dehalococcoidia bacterium]
MNKHSLATLPDPPPALGLERDVSLARHTYLRIGGAAAYFGTPPDIDTFVRIWAWAKSHTIPLRIIGGGSNMLVADEGVRAVVISLRRACGYLDIEGTAVHAGAAVMLPAIAKAAAERGLSGMEFAIGIPGDIGGAMQTNAGIGDGRSMGDVVTSVDVLRDGVPVTLSREQIAFDYRHTSLRTAGEIVLAAQLALKPRPLDEVEAEMSRLLGTRQATQPTAEPNAGSVFRNPPGDRAGQMIEAVGGKNVASGSAHVSSLHANFIVHDGNASASEYLDVMTEVQRLVLATYGVRLIPEIEWWGDGTPPEVFQ